MQAPRPRQRRFRIRLTRIWDGVCMVLCLMTVLVGLMLIAGGRIMHQLAPTVAGGCFIAIGVICLLNRLWFRPLLPFADEIPFFSAFHRRPWLLAICLALEAMAFEAFFIWPSSYGPYW
jgi:hypothetical protein